MLEEVPLAIITGGGWVARHYITEAKKNGLSTDIQDNIGISVTRLNASTLNSFIGKDQMSIPKNVSTASQIFKNNGIAIMGGTVPGHTTDAVSAELAEKIDASRMLNVTSVDGVYTSDPRKDSDARRYKTMDFQEVEISLMLLLYQAGSLRLDFH